jgi:endonuclease/exonuclease/phosphatase family metal-dependent hydrolase
MKIASYNIMAGGFSDFRYDIPTPERLPKIQEAIRTVDADLIGLIDTFRWDELYTADDLKELFGYEYSYCINLNDDRLRALGHNNGITVLTHISGCSFETVRIFSRDAVKVIVPSEVGDIHVFVIYLDDLSESVRMKQVEVLAKYLDASMKTIIMGDLNTFSPDDFPVLFPRLAKFFQSQPEMEARLKPSLDENKKGEVIPFLEQRGLVDADMKNRETTAVTKLIGTPLVRVDYALATEDAKINGFKVWKDQIFDEASDHYPISFEI